jgi:predicted solute-binding protein
LFYFCLSILQRFNDRVSIFDDLWVDHWQSIQNVLVMVSVGGQAISSYQSSSASDAALGRLMVLLLHLDRVFALLLHACSCETAARSTLEFVACSAACL